MGNSWQQPVMLNRPSGRFTPQRLPGTGGLNARQGLLQQLRAACGAWLLQPPDEARARDGARLARGRKARDGTDHTAPPVDVAAPVDVRADRSMAAGLVLARFVL